MPDRWGRPTFQDGLAVVGTVEHFQDRAANKDAYKVAEAIANKQDLSNFSPESKYKGARMYWDNQFAEVKTKTRDQSRSNYAIREKLLKQQQNLQDAQEKLRMYRAMRAAGMAIGAHSRTHPHLDRLPVEHHPDEVGGSRQDLEQVLGEPVPHFAWPNPSGGGTVNDTARAAAMRAGFLTAVTSVPGPITPDVDWLKLPRLGVYAGEQERLLFRLLERRGGR